MKIKLWLRKIKKNAQRSELGFLNLARRTCKYRFPAIVDRLIHKRAMQWVSYPRVKHKPIPKKFLLVNRRHD
jgi:hypothetical protein